MEIKMILKKDILNFLGLIKTWMKGLKNRNGLRSINDRVLRNIGSTRIDVVQGTNELFRI
jgi:uncharacterized protein YjiS (DUF1127 family)